MDGQAATDCGGWRAGHNGGDRASWVSVSEARPRSSRRCSMTDKTNGKTGYTKMISIQIAAPQRTTNPANESQTSRSSRVMFRVPLDDVGLAAKCGYPAALMRYLNNRVQSCYRAPVIWFFAPRPPERKPRTAQRGIEPFGCLRSIGYVRGNIVKITSP
jgi:hypothetical protein